MLWGNTEALSEHDRMHSAFQGRLVPLSDSDSCLQITPQPLQMGRRAGPHVCKLHTGHGDMPEHSYGERVLQICKLTHKKRQGTQAASQPSNPSLARGVHV